MFTGGFNDEEKHRTHQMRPEEEGEEKGGRERERDCVMRKRERGERGERLRCEKKREERERREIAL